MHQPSTFRRAANDDPPPEAAPAAAASLRLAMQLRALRARHFAPELFADPAWDMLLDLALAETEGRRLAVSDLCIASGVPQTTALRWMQQLERRALLARAADPHDRRRVLVSATPETMARMRAFWADADAACRR